MRARQEVHERRQFSVVSRPSNQVKMVGHNAVGQDSQGNAALRFSRTPQERTVIIRGVKEPEAPRTAVQDVEDDSAGSGLFSPRHAMGVFKFPAGQTDIGCRFYTNRKTDTRCRFLLHRQRHQRGVAARSGRDHDHLPA
jgi:hypothetical protein